VLLQGDATAAPDGGVDVGASSSSPASVAADAVKTQSDCVPPNTVVVSWANRHHRPLFSAQIKNVQREDCFMSRYVLVALDGFMKEYCEELARDGVKIRCARSTRDLGMVGEEADDGGDRELSGQALATHLSGRWNDVDALVSAGINAWAFDVDVAMLGVPSLDEASKVEGDTCDVLYQRRTPQSEQLLLADGGAIGNIGGGILGQMFFRANDKVGPSYSLQQHRTR
jgi:hypothetical protein